MKVFLTFFINSSCFFKVNFYTWFFIFMMINFSYSYFYIVNRRSLFCSSFLFVQAFLPTVFFWFFFKSFSGRKKSGCPRYLLFYHQLFFVWRVCIRMCCCGSRRIWHLLLLSGFLIFARYFSAAPILWEKRWKLPFGCWACIWHPCWFFIWSLQSKCKAIPIQLVLVMISIKNCIICLYSLLFSLFALWFSAQLLFFTNFGKSKWHSRTQPFSVYLWLHKYF